LKRNIFIRNIDAETWNEFRSLVAYKENKLHGVLGEAVTEALKLYIERFKSTSNSTHTHFRKKKGKIAEDAEVLKQKILDIAEPGGTIHKSQIEQIAAGCLGIGDGRSVRARINYLVGTGFLSLGTIRGTYRINGGAKNEAEANRIRRV